MKKFLLTHTLYNIHIKLIILGILNTSDYFFTKILLNTNLYYEANIIMRNIINNLVLSLLIKIILPLALLCILFKRLTKATVKQLYIANILINIIVAAYSLLNIFHLGNIFLLKIYNVI